MSLGGLSEFVRALGGAGKQIEKRGLAALGHGGGDGEALPAVLLHLQQDLGAQDVERRGCTSGQALSGGAVLSVGSWAFMFAVFAGAYALAYFLRRYWN